MKTKENESGQNLPALQPQNYVELAAKLDEAKLQPVKMNVEPWDPDKPGDLLSGVFVGFEDVAMPNQADPGKIEQVKCAIVLTREPVVDKTSGEIVAHQVVKKSIAAKRAVSFFERQEPGSMWRCVFKGKAKNKTNNKESNVYDFYQLTV